MNMIVRTMSCTFHITRTVGKKQRPPYVAPQKKVCVVHVYGRPFRLPARISILLCCCAAEQSVLHDTMGIMIIDTWYLVHNKCMIRDRYSYTK